MATWSSEDSEEEKSENPDDEAILEKCEAQSHSPSTSQQAQATPTRSKGKKVKRPRRSTQGSTEQSTLESSQIPSKIPKLVPVKRKRKMLAKNEFRQIKEFVTNIPLNRWRIMLKQS